MTDDATLDRDGQSVTVRVPLKIRRHGGRKMIIAPEGAAPWAPPRARIDNTMVKAIARAFRWRRLLEEGQYGSVVELADAEKINKSYVSRVLRLSLLAPPIIEAILNGADAAGAAAGGVGISAQTPDGCTAVHCGEVICRTHRTLSWRLARSRAKRNHFQNPLPSISLA
jgi:hypothetical protein